MINVIYEQVCAPVLTLCWENVALEWMTEEGRSRRVFRALEIKLIKLRVFTYISNDLDKYRIM